VVFHGGAGAILERAELAVAGHLFMAITGVLAGSRAGRVLYQAPDPKGKVKGKGIKGHQNFDRKARLGNSLNDFS